MNKKVIFIIVVIFLAAGYILWNQYQKRLDEQEQQEFNQRATQEWAPYNTCMDAVEEKYKSNLKDLNLVGLSREKIDEKLAQYQEQYDQQSFECRKQYPAAAAARIRQEAFDRRIELQNKNYAPH